MSPSATNSRSTSNAPASPKTASSARSTGSPTSPASATAPPSRAPARARCASSPTASARACRPDCRGYLLSLERTGILSPQQREIVIERLLALDGPASHHAGAAYNPPEYNEELDVSQLKWVVLMVLSSQPGEELACSRMEDLVFDLAERPH